MRAVFPLLKFGALSAAVPLPACSNNSTTGSTLYNTVNLMSPPNLLSLLTNIHCRDVNEDAPLHLAAACGDTEMVQVLLSGGADENLPDKKRRTPLHVAARCAFEGPKCVISWRSMLTQ